MFMLVKRKIVEFVQKPQKVISKRCGRGRVEEPVADKG